MGPVDPAAADDLPAADTLRYGLPGLVLAVFGIPLFLLVPPHFIGEFGLAAGAVGLVLLAARLLDLLADPLVGHACRSAGRARLLLVAGVVLLLAGAAALFRPPPGAGLAWLFGGALVAYLGWSLVAVPLYALGAALPRSDAGRARLAVSREGFVLAGTLLALVLPVVAGQAADTSASLALLWWFLLPLLPLSLLALWPLPARAEWSGGLPWHGFAARSAALFRAGDFRRLLGAYFLNAVANGVPAALLVLYATHVLQAPDRLGLFLVLYLVAGLVALPFWLWFARRAGAGRAWWWSMLWAALAFTVVPWLGAGDVLVFALVCVATGLSVGADNALPAAWQARVAAALRTRGDADDAGLVFGWWGLATKLALAAGAALGLGAADLGGFDARAPDAAGLQALALAYGVLPVLLKLATCVLLHADLRRGGEA